MANKFSHECVVRPMLVGFRIVSNCPLRLARGGGDNVTPRPPHLGSGDLPGMWRKSPQSKGHAKRHFCRRPSAPRQRLPRASTPRASSIEIGQACDTQALMLVFFVVQPLAPEVVSNEFAKTAGKGIYKRPVHGLRGTDIGASYTIPMRCAHF